MKLRLPLLLFCLFGTGLFSHAQSRKKDKPVILNADESLPVTVVSKKKPKSPPPLPPQVDKNGKPLPPPKIEVTHFKAPPPPPPVEERRNNKAVKFAPPRIMKDEHGNPIAPPPPPIEARKNTKGVTKFTPPKIVKDEPKPGKG